MSYEVIARKWRPRTFDEVVGQSHVTTALRNAIRSDRVPHALLLTGPRGVGKTTLARILARCLNCEKGPTDEPCGTCVFCEEISSGRSTDVQEIDAASRTSVDDVRDLIESIRYAPTPGKYRIFVVDEVHMLSGAAFNALLKTLEEPPPHSLFIFATTNPEKIPFTVISRCQRYDLRRIQIGDVADQLGHIAESEGVSVSKASLLSIAREGEGSMRDAQTLLDQLIAYGGTEIADEIVAEVLDLIDRRVLLAIAGACIDGDAPAALDACGRAIESGGDAKRLAGALVQLLRDLVVLAVAPDSTGLVEASDAELEELRDLVARCEPARLRRMFRALVKEQEDLAWAPQPYAVLEMAIVRLATLPAGDDVTRLLARLEALERQLAAGGASGRGGGSGGAGAPQPRGEQRSSGAPRSGGARKASTRQAGALQAGALQDGAPQDGAPQDGAERAGALQAGAPQDGAPQRRTPSAAPTEDRAKTASAATEGDDDAARDEAAPLASAIPTGDAARDQTAPLAPPTATGDDAPLAIVFDRLRAFAQEHDRGGFASLEGGRLLERTSERLCIEARNAFHAKRLRDRAEALEALCSRFFGCPMQVELREPEATGAARVPSSDVGAREPGENAARREEERKLRQAALQHPAVNVALEVLEASIVDIQPIRPGRSSRSARSAPSAGSQPADPSR